ncbi:MAG: replication protein [Candidatus Paceibacterota bacterium]|jgi:phage replication O-like protein O
METNIGYFKIPNLVAETLARINLSKYETRLLWVIMRKTWGWNKDEDLISVSQFEKATGINRRNAYPALLRLEKKKIIQISKASKANKINSYRINSEIGIQPSEIKGIDPTIKTIIPSNNVIPTNNPSLFKDITSPLSQGIITKDNGNTPIQNTNNNKQATNQSPLQKLVTYYKQLYKVKFNQEPTISSLSWGKWGRLLKIKLEQGYSLREIAILLQAFSKSKDSNSDKLGFDLGIFFSDSIFNKVRAAQGRSTNVTNLEDKYGKY